MRLNASLGFWLLCAAALLWIFGSLYSDEGSPIFLNLLRAIGFLMAALALRTERPHARLLGLGVLLAGLADVLSLPSLMRFLGTFESFVEGSEFLGSIWLVVLGVRWIATGRTGGLRSLRWGILLIGLTAFYWTFASMLDPSDYVWIPGNIAAAAGAAIVFVALSKDMD